MGGMKKKELLELLKRKDDEIEYLKRKIDVLEDRVRWKEITIDLLCEE